MLFCIPAFMITTIATPGPIQNLRKIFEYLLEAAILRLVDQGSLLEARSINLFLFALAMKRKKNDIAGPATLAISFV